MRPDIRFVYQDKETKKTAECGVAWLNNFGGFNLRPQTEKVDGEYPKIPMARALELFGQGKGWLNAYACERDAKVIIDSAAPNDDF